MAEHDVVLRGGTIVDGAGGPPVVGALAIDGDRIAAIGRVSARGRREIDARGLVVAPGFINMLSWAFDSLMADGRSQSDIRQGVTLEVFGEGRSAGPYTERMRQDEQERQADIRYPVDWTTLGEGLERLAGHGVSCNIASFVGATTVRVNVIGEEDRAPSVEELEQMRDLVRLGMREGALGISSSLIYAPACFAKTNELVALAAAAGEGGGMYVSHLRNEGDRLVEAVEELIEIARRAGVRAEIYHLKQAGQANWRKLDEVIARVDAARDRGLAISADMYPYTAGATGLDAAMPRWVQDGGHRAWVTRLREPAIRARVRNEMRAPGSDWDNLYAAAGSAENVMLLSFKNPILKPYTGKTLGAVAALRGVSPEDAAIDLVIEDDSRVGTAYFLMTEDNVRRQIALPWMSFCSDSGSVAPEGVFLLSNPHPRAYGAFARVVGHYGRMPGAPPLKELIRRLTSLPAETLRLRERGRRVAGWFADVVAFDPDAFADHATFSDPHRYATGMRHVLVNGVLVLTDGEHTGELPGRVVRGPAWDPGTSASRAAAIA
ncbi:MAG: D-aminoacylase [Candidatus Limnocylindrales bacterium]